MKCVHCVGLFDKNSPDCSRLGSRWICEPPSTPLKRYHGLSRIMITIFLITNFTDIIDIIFFLIRHLILGNETGPADIHPLTWWHHSYYYQMSFKSHVPLLHQYLIEQLYHLSPFWVLKRTHMWGNSAIWAWSAARPAMYMMVTVAIEETLLKMERDIGLVPTCQGDVSLGRPATLWKLNLLLNHRLICLILHRGLDFWTFNPVQHFTGWTFCHGWWSPEVGSLAADLILFWTLWVTQVKCEVGRTSHVYQTFSICGEKELKKWIKNLGTCDDCVVVVAVPSIGTGISFVGVVITFQIGVAVIEHIS